MPRGGRKNRKKQPVRRKNASTSDSGSKCKCSTPEPDKDLRRARLLVLWMQGLGAAGQVAILAHQFLHW